jgi:hypothetical protein
MQQLRCDKSECNPKQHRGSGSENAPFQTLAPGKGLDRHGDHHGIIPRQHKVYEDNTEERKEETPGKLDLA